MPGELPAPLRRGRRTALLQVARNSASAEATRLTPTPTTRKATLSLSPISDSRSTPVMAPAGEHVVRPFAGEPAEAGTSSKAPPPPPAPRQSRAARRGRADRPAAGSAMHTNFRVATTRTGPGARAGGLLQCPDHGSFGCTLAGEALGLVIGAADRLARNSADMSRGEAAADAQRKRQRGGRDFADDRAGQQKEEHDDHSDQHALQLAGEMGDQTQPPARRNT